MSLAAGTRIGPYEVVSSVGAGGMGEVYRARDTRLHRDVALKLLPDEFAGDAQRLARFEREAQLLAALHHPNIAGILGLEDSAGQRAIVMEFVDGRELSGPLPVEEALTIARQVAEAIEAAHDRGVIHRDLKPANIKVTADGTVKVLDFGLAKALQGGDDASAPAHLTHSPTMSIGATQAGMVLGTAAYMAPEQAKGRPADRRADIWAFGVVLYELLTGRRMFGGDSAAETLASVMKDPIALDALPAETPPAVRRLLARCLERDVRRRLQSIGEARIVIEDVLSGRSDAAPLAAAGIGQARRGSWLAWAVAVAALGFSGVLLFRTPRFPDPPPPSAIRFTLAPPSGTVLTLNRSGGPQFAVSPDGRRVVFVADDVDGGQALWVQSLDALSARRLDRTRDAFYPFWSPDSQQIGYFAAGRLMRIAAAGEAPLVVAAAPNGQGGSWFQSGTEGVIVFGPNLNGPLHTVPATGGTSVPFTTMADGESGHAFPQVLPDGRVMFSARGERPGVYVQDLGSNLRTKLADGLTRALYVEPGVLLYPQDSALFGRRFALSGLLATGEPWAIASDVRVSLGNGAGFAAAATTGLLVYRSGLDGAEVVVRTYTRDGVPGEVVIGPGVISHLDLSPDGDRLAVALGSATSRDLWIRDLPGGAFTRFTTLAGQESQPAWSPDSRRLAFMNDGRLQHASLGSSEPTAVTGADGYVFLEQWAPDNRYLLARTATDTVGLIPAPTANGVAPGAESSAEAVATFRFRTDHFQISPDGRWVAYTSEESGRVEVMVAPFPALTPRRQVSVSGGAQPRWRGDGRELFFHSPDQQMFAVTVTPGDALQVGRPRLLFRTNPAVHSNAVFHYAVTPDGQRFFLREPAPGSSAAAAESLHLVANWAALAK